MKRWFSTAPISPRMARGNAQVGTNNACARRVSLSVLSSDQRANRAPHPDPLPRAPWGLNPKDQWCLACALVACLMMVTYRLAWTLGPAPYLIRVEDLPYQSTDFRISINQTDWPPLDLLPGLSERLARQIVAYREAHGPFRSPQDLLEVPGIGPRLVDRLTPHLTGWAQDDGTAMETGQPADIPP